MPTRKNPQKETSGRNVKPTKKSKKSRAATGLKKAVENPSDIFQIVGIGASAGGLAAFEAFFSGMPADREPDMAFVLVQHLAPDHKSILTDLIRRYTRMQVFEVEDGIVVEPNTAYIIPPNKDMALLNGTLQLMDFVAPHGQRLPIDFFFRSLANDQGERSIGIILSGTGSDGTQGIRAIKGAGGMVMAQNPESTDYDGMPKSAIGTELVDYIMPPAEMPAQLISYVTHAYLKPSLAKETPDQKNDNTLKKILALLRIKTGNDFSQYKLNSIYRRIERRMAVHQIETIDEYLRYIEKMPSELNALFHELLIGVSSFFRDTDAFNVLEEQVIPQLFAGKPEGALIRVWIVGCFTGEEAYSIAILIQEHLENMKKNYQIQVFATDIDSKAIAAARTGLYPPGIAADISHERLSRFFTIDHTIADGTPGAYRIKKSIRDMLIFSEHNIIKDPPFSKLDLISCRNLLIYMNSDLQKRLMPVFHYALNPGAFLFLGTSETVSDFDSLYVILDSKNKIYQSKEVVHKAQSAVAGRIFSPVSAEIVTLPVSIGGEMAYTGESSLRELTVQTIIQQVAPVAILVNMQGDILYFHGRTGKYLEPAPGKANANNIHKMAREGLQHELIAALHNVAKNNEIVRHLGLRVKTNGDYATVNLTVCPVVTGSVTKPDPPLFLIIFEETTLNSPQQVSVKSITDQNNPEALSDARLSALKHELQSKDEYLRALTEQMATSNEELTSSNEEMQSINEELQSTNEELETSKEELQSVNEELATVNAELQTKVADLSRLNNDMNNLLSGTGIATVFVDHQQHILRFTPTAVEIINMIQSDIGRPLGHIVSNLVEYDTLVEDVQSVLDTLVPKEFEVQTKADLWFTMRIQPYRTIENVIEGAVITFVDITKRKLSEDALLKLKDEIRILHGIIPICSHCKKIRDDKGSWNQMEVYIRNHSEADFSHGICPDCMKEHYPEIEEDEGNAQEDDDDKS